MVDVGKISVVVAYKTLDLSIVCVGCISMVLVCCVLDIFIMFDDVSIIFDDVSCERPGEDLLLTNSTILLLSEITGVLEVNVETISVLVGKVSSVLGV